MSELKNIMFWSESYDPNNFVWRVDHLNPIDVEKVVKFLKEGILHNQQRGPARCRINGSLKMLGSADRKNGPFNYPDQCWYYIEEYGVWTPELDEVLKYIMGTSQKPILQQVIDEYLNENPDLSPIIMGTVSPVIASNPPPPQRKESVSIERVDGYQVLVKDVGKIRYLPSLEGINRRDLNLDISAVTMLKITEGQDVRYAMEVTFETPDQFNRKQLLSTLTEEQKRLLFQVK